MAHTCLSTEVYNVCNVHMGKCAGAVDHATLANHWQISLEKGKNMMEWMTQRGVHTVLHPTLSWHFRTNDRMLCYRRMLCNLYSNTMFCPKIPLVCDYTIVQIFAADFRWSQRHPLK